VADDPIAHLFDDLDLDDARWVTLAEAEEATGVSRSALRAWFRNGEIPARIEDGPHGPQRLVPLDTVVDRARLAAGRIGRPRRGDTSGAGDDTVRQLVGALMDQLVTARTEIADLRRRIDALERRG
jgi:hypothetical protein